MNIGLPHFLTVSAALFALGLFAVMSRRNAVAILMGVELMLNAANLNFVAFSRYVQHGIDGLAPPPHGAGGRGGGRGPGHRAGAVPQLRLGARGHRAKPEAIRENHRR